MKIHHFDQGSEQWEQIRKGKATSSRFKDIVTPKKLELSASSQRYAAQLIAERLAVESPAFQGTYWMDNGRGTAMSNTNEACDEVDMDAATVALEFGVML